MVYKTALNHKQLSLFHCAMDGIQCYIDWDRIKVLLINDQDPLTLLLTSPSTSISNFSDIQVVLPAQVLTHAVACETRDVSQIRFYDFYHFFKHPWRWAMGHIGDDFYYRITTEILQ